MRMLMTVAALVVGLAAFCGGCGGLTVDMTRVVPAPDGFEAQQTAILAALGTTAQPLVYWYSEASSDCHGGDGAPGFKGVHGACVAGEQLDGVMVIQERRGRPLSETGLVHEDAHFASDQLGQGGDAGHVGHFFKYTDGRAVACSDGFGGDVCDYRLTMQALGM